METHIPTKEEVLAVVEYNQLTREFRWKKRHDRSPQWNGHYAGNPAGIGSKGRKGTIKINGKSYYAVHLAHLVCTGEWPVEYTENGHKASIETRKKLSDSHKGKRYLLGTKRPDITGDKHFAWKGGHENKLFSNRRRKAQKKSNGGSHTLVEWIALKVSHGFCCAHCKQAEPNIKLTQDHIVPISKGGTDSIENIQPLCHSCNSKKGSKLIITKDQEWLLLLMQASSR